MKLLISLRSLGSTYIADSPSNCAFLTCSACLISLTFNTKIHDVITTNSAIVYDDICEEK